MQRRSFNLEQPFIQNASVRVILRVEPFYTQKENNHELKETLEAFLNFELKEKRRQL